MADGRTKVITNAGGINPTAAAHAAVDTARKLGVTGVKIATVVGDIVYFSNFGHKDTTGLGARTGRKVFHMGRGSFNPVISDGRTIFLTGYSSLYALRAK